MRTQLTKMLEFFMAEVAMIVAKAELLGWSEERKEEAFMQVFNEAVRQFEEYMIEKIEEEVQRNKYD